MSDWNRRAASSYKVMVNEKKRELFPKYIKNIVIMDEQKKPMPQ